MNSKTINRVDAFAIGRFKGNPSGVYYLQEDLADSELQQIALLARLPVTAFVERLPKNEFNIRWFTMNCEVNLCGHGTMAASYWLFKTQEEATEQTLGTKEIRYQSKSGPLAARITSDGKIEMDFPTQPTKVCDEATKKEIEKVLGTTVKTCWFGYEDYLVELESAKEVVDFIPDFSKIKQVDCRGIIITAWDEQYGYDCVSRFFCPQVAIDEDQVCVSAHCKILPFWQEKKGRNHLHAWQASANGGELNLYALEGNRVRIQGAARKGDAVVIDWPETK